MQSFGQMKTAEEGQRLDVGDRSQNSEKIKCARGSGLPSKKMSLRFLPDQLRLRFWVGSGLWHLAFSF